MIEIFDNFDDLDERGVKECAERLQREVFEGKVEARWRLAALYEDGLGVEQDLRRAFELREQGALANEPNAIVWLAYSYEYAAGTRYNLDKALELYQRAVEEFSDFRSRGFACCQFSIHKVLRRAKSFLILEKGDVDSRRYQTIVDVDEEDRRVREIFEQCDPSADPFYCVEAAYLLRKLGEPRAICEEAAARMEEEALVMLEKAARRGNPFATFKLAEADVGENDESIDRILQAAEAGCAPALVKAGYLYECDGRADEALKYYAKAAELDYPDGLCKAGSILEESGDLEAAVGFYRRGAEFNHEPSLYMLGNYCWDLNDDKAYAAECWRRSADGGFALAMERYAEYLKAELDENSPDESWAEVAAYYRGAMNEGVDSSKVMYAGLLNVGRGVAKDEREAERLFREIEESGDAESKEILAYLKYRGEFCDRDVPGANSLLADAALERPTAQVALGVNYYSGRFVPPDYRRAAQLFGEAAKKGFPDGLNLFSRCCYEGRGVFRNDVAGEFFLRLAAEKGCADAACRLGNMFADGEFGTCRWDLAAQWFRVASLKRDATATNRLAFCYWNGLGVPRDRVLGAFYWGLADEFGCGDALEELSRSKLAFAVEQLFCETEDPLEKKRNAFLADSMKEWMKTRSESSGDLPKRAEFLEEYQSKMTAYVDALRDDASGVVSSGASDYFGAVQTLLDLYGECADADASRTAFSKGEFEI